MPLESTPSDSRPGGLTPAAPGGPADAQRLPLPNVVRFEELNPQGEEIWIENDGQVYRLRRTRQGKLILTK